MGTASLYALHTLCEPYLRVCHPQILCSVILSSVAFIAETTMNKQYPTFFRAVELVFVVICSLEVFLRLVSASTVADVAKVGR